MEKKFYYKENQIEEILKCPICHMKMYEPKLLPCGESICSKCSIKQAGETNEFTCTHCNEVHFSPKQGFPTNKRLAKLAEEVPVARPKTRTERLLRSYVKDAKTKAGNLVKNIQQSTDLMRQHAINIRNDIQMAADSAVDAINKTHEELFHK